MMEYAPKCERHLPKTMASVKTIVEAERAVSIDYAREYE